MPTGLIASGSHDIHLRADHIGLVNCFKSYPGSGHVGYLTSDYAVAMDWTALFLGQLVCGAPVTCGAIGTGIVRGGGRAHDRLPESDDRPCADAAHWCCPSHIARCFGTRGAQRTLGAGTAQVDLSALADGVYTAQLSGTVTETFRIVKAN
ncbi:MAG: hypothetical protein IPL52_10985 [Flavobacteriales bacterium]|nr:hypothetical protein [Flavobacteriales bacterium]